MAFIKLCILIVAISGLAAANPAVKQSFWKGTPMDGMVEEMRSSCSDGNDALACMKFKVMNFLDTMFKKDSYKITDDIEVRSNGFSGNNDISSARSETDVVDKIETYLQGHDITFNVPVADAKVTFSPRNINDNELNLKLKFMEEARGKKSKLKKIIAPIMVFILLKAITVVPLLLGVLGLKAWNALQLSFFSFVISIALAIFQLCKKIADNHPPIATHAGWEAGRLLDGFIAEPQPIEAGQNLAYNAYA